MSAVSIQQAFDLAVRHHQAGRLAEAEALYRQILQAQPNHPGALHYLGVIAHQVGRHDQALEQIRRSIDLDPANPTPHSNLGEAYRGLGRLDEAVAAFQRALELNPNHVSAHLNLGGAYRASGQLAEALACYRRVIELQPDFAQAHYNLGVLLAEAGHLDEAVAAYRRALDLEPKHADACYNLGIVLTGQRRLDEAIRSFRRALELKPDFPAACNYLGMALAERQQWEEAIASYRRAIEMRPDFPEAHNNLGIALRFRGNLEGAVAAYRRALQIKPEFAEVHNNLGDALAEAGRFDEAITELNAALQLRPDFTKAHHQLGGILTHQGRFAEAATAYRRAIELEPNDAEAHKNLGNVLRYQRHFDTATAAYLRALELKPRFADARFGLAQLHLLLGDFESGWPMYEARWDVFSSARRNFSQPLWDGAPLRGERVLIHAEQGLGDAVQFIRYAPLAVERGAQVVIECPRSLAELFRSAPGVHEVIAASDLLPPFDLHLPMLSQPLVFQKTAKNISREAPYLFANSVRCESWRIRLDAGKSNLRVGLAWQGNPKTILLRKRHLKLRKLLPLWNVKGIEFVSLQVGPGAEQVADLSGGAPIIDLVSDIRDFADTAALMMNLDLIISVDTAVAHLAGALGRPIWTLVPYVPDWRWGLEREESPWYPTMRLFRQVAMDDWDAVIQRVARELEKYPRPGGG